MKHYLFEPLKHHNIERTWSLFEKLKIEGAEVSFTELENLEALKSWIDNPAQLTYVAIDGDTHTVCAAIRGRRDLSPEKKHAAFLTAATAPEFRGDGLAAKLTLWALDQMKAQGVTIARIYVYSDNTSSLNAVKKLGFIKAGIVKAHHIHPKTGIEVDDVIFHKILS